MSKPTPECKDCKYYYMVEGYPWCVHKQSNSPLGFRTTDVMKYKGYPCEGYRLFEPKHDESFKVRSSK